MLIEFSVKNYLSFKDRVTLSLVASTDRTHLENTFPVGDAPSAPHLLKSVAIYGANASGKSNLIKALFFATGLVLTSATRQQGDKIPLVPFKLDAETVREPSEFEFVFMLNGQRFVYGFAADTERVHEEWLTAALPRRKPKALFRRFADGAMQFGTSWKGEKSKIRKLTRPNALFLSVAAQFNHPTVEPVFAWFKDGIKSISEQPEIESEMRFTIRLLSRDLGFLEFLRRLVGAADLAIERVEMERRAVTEEVRQGLSEAVGEAQAAALFPRGMESLTEIIVLRSLHRANDGSEVAFEMAFEESEGTIRLFSVAGPWFYVLNRGCVLLVDELDAHLHPHLTRFLLGLIHQSKTSQLIFTTHDCSLLDPDLFRRDQIWFTEKDKSGATDLYSLGDIAVRKDENFRIGYLKGRYGGIPFVGDLKFEQTEG